MRIDLSHILGLLILRKGVTTKDEVDVVSKRLLMINPNYEVVNNIDNTLEYYRDFFTVKENGVILSSGDCTEYLNILFVDTLAPEVLDDIDKVISFSTKKR